MLSSLNILKHLRIHSRAGSKDIHGVDFTNNDGEPMDDQMHGSHCAGTVAAKGNNTVGIAGVAWKGGGPGESLGCLPSAYLT